MVLLSGDESCESYLNCPLCEFGNLKFKNLEYLRRHMLQHPTVRLKIRCKNCLEYRNWDSHGIGMSYMVKHCKTCSGEGTTKSEIPARYVCSTVVVKLFFLYFFRALQDQLKNLYLVQFGYDRDF